MGITVSALTMHRPVVKCDPQKGQLAIRIIDSKRPANSVRVVIPHQELLALLAKVHRLTLVPGMKAEPSEWDAMKAELHTEPVPAGEESTD